MKKFLTKTLCFFLPLAIISYPLDHAISYYLNKSNDYPGEFEVWNDIYSGKANCDIAIYGSSRAWVHINPGIIRDSLNQTAYNFGIDGHNFWLQHLRHLEFQKFNKKPKTIILSVDVFSLQKKEDLYQPNQFLPYLLWNWNITKYTMPFSVYHIIDYYIPLIRYAGKHSALETSMKNFIMKTPAIRYRTNGFKAMDKEWNDDFKKATSNNTTFEIKLDNNIIALLELFILECKANKIELILVYTPEYIDGQNYVSNRKSIINTYKILSSRHQLIFLDYSNDSICFEKALFYNASHLNKKGADIFSRKLAGDIKHRHTPSLLQHNYSYQKTN